MNKTFQIQLRSAGLTDQHIAEISAALAVLAKYGILGVGLGIGGAHAGALPVSSYLSVMDQAGANAANTGVFGAVGQINLGECLGKQFV